MSRQSRSSTHFRYVAANVQHGDAAKGGAPEQALSAADFLDNVECECAHSQGLCNTIESSREELSGGSCNPEGLEDARGVISDDVLRYELETGERHDGVIGHQENLQHQ